MCFGIHVINAIQTTDATIRWGNPLLFQRLGGETSICPQSAFSDGSMYDARSPIPGSLRLDLAPPNEPGQESPPGGADERWRGDGERIKRAETAGRILMADSVEFEAPRESICPLS
jgi:hypothetical protein